MSLYPSLEDMKVDQMAQAQYRAVQQPSAPIPQNGAHAYPSLADYMGLEFSETFLAANLPEYSQVAIKQQSNYPALNGGMVAPISGQSLGLQRAQVTNGIRELVLCKDKDGKLGLRVKDINKGIFVCLVVDKSPAALGGVRFGDQILQINGDNVAGFNVSKVHEIFRRCPVNGIKIVVRDRPFERTITLHKDSANCIGFQFKNGKITSLVKDSSAVRNGVLTEHQLLEIDGRNVVGLKDKEICAIIENAPKVVTVTVIPTYIYEHMVKKMSGSLLKDLMDHSLPMM